MHLFSSGKHIFNLLIFITALHLTAQQPDSRQPKEFYRDLSWNTFKTDHFNIHYFTTEKDAAKDAARLAEHGFEYLSATFNHKFKDRISLILLTSINDLQQGATPHHAVYTQNDFSRHFGEIMLPMTGSSRQLKQALVHELAHLFQFDIVKSIHLGSEGTTRFDPPPWFIEGMAEYLAAGMDKITRICVKDYLMHDNHLSLDELDHSKGNHISRIGESIWDYIGSSFGQKKIGPILKSTVRFGSIDEALKQAIGLNQHELAKQWHAAMSKDMFPRDNVLLKAEQVARRLTKKENESHQLNLAPAISPNGKSIAYIANRDLTNDIFLLQEEANGTFKNRKLFNGRESRGIDDRHFAETSLNWSKDGKYLTFVTRENEDDAIIIIHVKSRRVFRKIVFSDLNSILSPSFSPDGKVLTFVGISGGRSNIYTLNLASGFRRQLTKDRFATFHPQWSPDGNHIAYITDKGSITDREKPLFGSYKLATFNLQTDAIVIQSTLKGNITSPNWSPNGTEVAFVSDFQGIPNIYKLNLKNKTILPLTHLEPGISGITELMPAMSWSRNGRYMAFSSLHKGAWQIYRLELPGTMPYQVYHIDNKDGASARSACE